jgi:hypothetical protein
MSEFLNRVSAQRMILQAVNRCGLASDELVGLSSGAIDRWIIVNQLGQTAPIVRLVRRAAERLFCLANKSHEQVSEEYFLASEEIKLIVREIDLMSANIDI